MTDATHAYVVFSGTLIDHPEEHWQFGVRFLLVNSGTAPDNVGTLPTFTVNAAAVHRTETDWTISSSFEAGLGIGETISPDDWLNDQLAPAFSDLMDNAHISAKCKAERIKVSPITSSGHVADDRTAVLEWTGSNPVGSVGNLVPPQLSIVTSWQTDRIGRHGKGRIFLPPAGSSVINGDGYVSDADAGDIKDAGVAFLEACAITPTGLGNHWALPIVTGSPWTSYGVITSVRVGDGFDTHRSRRRSIGEVYFTGATSYG